MADSDDNGSLAPEFLDAGWGEIDLMDAYMVLDDLLDEMDERGYM